MKYVDEYRDAEAARGLARAIAAIATRPWRIMEVCGGQTHAIARFGLEELLPPGIDAPARARLPGVRHARGDARPRGRARAAARGGALLLRRHAARARLDDRSAHREGRGGGRARGVLGARRARARADAARARRSCSSRSASRRRRRVTRSRCTRPGARGCATSRCWSRTCSCRPRSRRSSPTPDRRVDGFLAAGHVCTIMGDRRVRAGRAPPPRADRGDRLRAGRHPAGRCTCACASSRRGAPRSRTRTRARCATAATMPRSAMIREVFVVRDRRWRGIGDIAGERPRARARRTPSSTPSGPLRARRTSAGAAGADADRECRSGLVLRRQAQAAGVPGVRHAVHAGAPARRDDGVVRGRVRRVLPVPEDRRDVRSELSGAARGRGDPARARRRRARDVAPAPRARAARRSARRTGRRRTTRPSSRCPRGARLAFTTDASVVRPLFFPGGDIGRLAVFGAVNDLAAAGARPLALSLSLDPRGGAAARDAAPRARVDRRGVADRGGARGDGRHEGRRSRQGRRDLRVGRGDRRDRAGGRGRPAADPGRATP